MTSVTIVGAAKPSVTVSGDLYAQVSVVGPSHVSVVPGAEMVVGSTQLLECDETISALRAVAVSEPGHVVYADPGTAAGRSPLGVTTSAAAVGGHVSVVTEGAVQDDSWNWEAGAPVLLGASGALTQTQPPGQNTMVVIGQALSDKILMVRVGPPIQLAG